LEASRKIYYDTPLNSSLSQKNKKTKKQKKNRKVIMIDRYIATKQYCSYSGIVDFYTRS